MTRIFLDNLMLNKVEIAYLKKNGYEISGNYTNCKLGIFVDSKTFPKKFKGIKLIYVQEPEVVRPDLYKKKKLKKYDYIIAASYERASRINADFVLPFSINIPNYIRKSNIRLGKAAIVNSNKFSSSKRSMYGLRRDVIIKSENSNIEIDVYGGMWRDGKVIELQRRFYSLRNQIFNKKPISIRETFSHLFYKYKNIKGMDLSEDCEVLQKYQFSIVIENDLDFISEKIWKSIYAGAVPIYIGPHIELDKKVLECIYVCEPITRKIIDKMSKFDPKELRKKRTKGFSLMKEMRRNVNYDLQFVINLTNILNSISFGEK